ncbi:MAG TPA: HAD family hydrolase, partial [Casimicrobiaceae bacterium]|nr:HAD family hydrolase [Casimicrobiaceae bacterium]
MTWSPPLILVTRGIVYGSGTAWRLFHVLHGKVPAMTTGAGDSTPGRPVGQPNRARQRRGQSLDGKTDLVVQGPHVLREDLEILQLMTGAIGIEPLTRARCDAYRLHEPTSVAGVPEACEAAHFDFALVPHDEPWSHVRLVALDMDSTLITIECIDEIAALRGIGDDVARITAAAMRGEIDFRASLERRVALLAGMPETDLLRVYDERLQVSPGAVELLDACR